ncbi:MULTISPECIES: hypothetical protein [unclassified Polaribacter]|uniref:hypothetical protein n=1 Tax=unclassified Polaribacter TaxID=196858 RepID=UPI0011BF1487|nr:MULTISPECIES: hypothetical protein [unclassified Polaribacter]TXD52650.1 hypothetical protein ES043_07360 [Polaribacter sp. IC063]TXD60619.1 hypothetical protein ES044_06895 [Polaribacter sp. IC066]
MVKDLKNLIAKFIVRIKKGKKQVKKIITFRASNKDSTLVIVTKFKPEKYKPIIEMARTANCFNVVFIIIRGIIN